MADPVGDTQFADGSGASAWTCPTCNNVYPGDFTVCPRDATPRTEQAVVAADALIGEVLGRTYRIVRVLGEGGMARLYEAEHLRIEARYAVKVIHTDLSRDPDLLARFEREARAAARIRSEHVVRMIDVLRTQDNRPCLVTELLEGEDLQALLDRVKKLSVAQAIPIARQICRAVAAAHAVGVVHRDLKPSNVFLCRAQSRTDRLRSVQPGAGVDTRTPPSGIDTLGSPLVKVFDFGVAKLEDDDRLTRTDAVMGTAAYMAPEQAKRAADAGPLSDVYSTSAVLYHMLTGEPPYGNVPAVSRLALVLHEEPARPRTLDPAIPDGIEAVIQHAMARDRTSRVQSALELEAQLAAFDRTPTATSLAPVAASAAATPVAGPGSGSATGDSIATQIVVRARIARPLAAIVAVASSLAAGAWIASLLAVIVQPSSGGEHALIGLFALAACAGVALLHVRMLRPSWRSAPAVIRHIRPTARALVAGGLTFGALELIADSMIAVFGSSALGGGARVILAGAAAVIGLAWQRFRLDERLQRRIG